MITTLSWLKEYIDIKLPVNTLGEKLTEVGLGTEKIEKKGTDTLFELEITPNRPDCLSMIGVAREVAAIEGTKIRFPKLKTDLKPTIKILPLEIKTDPKINPRFTGIIISGIKVKESPSWLKEKLESIGQRSINNIVDITNFVMFELGNPIHAFDYDKIEGKIMKVHQTKGGEEFKSVDGISYRLPKDAVVISDGDKIIDLCGIKGGFNSGTFEGTKNIFIRVPVEIPQLIRRTSQALGLRSDASSIFERGVNAGGTVDALKRCVDLVLEIAGGEIASELIDSKAEDFEPWKLNLRFKRLNQILGIEIPTSKILSILETLNLSPKLSRDGVECIIPTYRNDLKIEEDLIEEVARLYNYNKFPKTLPIGETPTNVVPYYKDYNLDRKILEILKAGGFSQVYTYSLISEENLVDNGINPENTLRVDNPVSAEYEYLRPTLKGNLRNALKQNKPYFKKVSLFELGKIYQGSSLDKANEIYVISGITNDKNFQETKGLLERMFGEIEDKKNAGEFIEVLPEGIFFEIPYSQFIGKANLNKKYRPLPKYPPVVEDLSFILSENVKTGDVIDEIKSQSSLIVDVSILDQFENSRAFHILYQNPNKNLSTEEVSKIREKVINNLKKKFDAKLK